MTRRLFLLNGLAILAVVCNHAAGWGFTAMFSWTDQYRAVTVPNYDQVGSFSYYILDILRQLTVFSVPAFLFVSGFFIAYAARGSQTRLSWKTVWNRVKNLLIPYFFWSMVVFAVLFILGEHYSPLEYVQKLIFGQALPAYYFVPLLVQLFILAPFLVPWAKNRWVLLLALFGLIQVGVTILRYIGLFNPQLAYLGRVPPWLFVSIAFFFPFGIVFGFHMQAFQQKLVRIRWGLLVASIVFAVISIIEQEFLYQNTPLPYGATFPSVSTSLWSASIILTFLAFEKFQIPFNKFFNDLGNKTYGIYLIHPLILLVLSRLIYHIFPTLLGYALILVLILVVFAIGLPVSAMNIVSRSRIRKTYRYVFG